MILDGWVICQNLLRITSDYMEKVSYWELLRTRKGRVLKIEKLGKSGEKIMFLLGFVPTLTEKHNFRDLCSTDWATGLAYEKIGLNITWICVKIIKIALS